MRRPEYTLSEQHPYFSFFLCVPTCEDQSTHSLSSTHTFSFFTVCADMQRPEYTLSEQHPYFSFLLCADMRRPKYTLSKQHPSYSFLLCVHTQRSCRGNITKAVTSFSTTSDLCLGCTLPFPLPVFMGSSNQAWNVCQYKGLGRRNTS
jgi:hypothetical protein